MAATRSWSVQANKTWKCCFDSCDLRIGRHVVIVLNPSVDAVVTVAFQQFFGLSALGFIKPVLDGQRTDLVVVEWKSLQCLELPSFNVHAHVINEARSLRSIENVPECLSGELDGWSFVSLHFRLRFNSIIKNATQSPPAQNFTRLPASLKTTALTTWQVRFSMCLGNASMQIPVQPFSSSALVFDVYVPSPDPTSTKNPSLTPGNTASDTHLS